MQIGQTIWAIDPCNDGSGENPRLTIGKGYEIKGVSEEEILIQNDYLRDHYFTLEAINKYFSLTPPEGKGGVKDLVLEAKGANVTIRAKMDKDKELGIETKYGKVFLTREQVTQLRDHLTEALNKLK